MNQMYEDYRRDGFLIIRQFLSVLEVQDMRLELERFIKDAVPQMPSNYVMYEDANDAATLKQLQDIHQYSPYFRTILENSRFSELAETLLAEPAVGKNIEYFNKPARIGKPTPPHQDAYYFMLNPPNAITMWMALEDVDEENGCVRYIRGSHLTGMRPHGRTSTLGFSQGITDYADNDFKHEIAVTAKPGDLLIHHSMTVHRADANKSNRSRRALGLIYFGASAKEDIVAKEAYRKKLLENRV